MLLLFEDEYWRQLAPLTYTRPTFDIRCGAFTPRERLSALLATYPARAVYPAGNGAVADAAVSPAAASETTLASLCRSYLMGCYGTKGGIAALLQDSRPLFLVNGCVLDISWLPALLESPVGTVYETGGRLLGAHISPALASVALYYLREQRSAEALEELQRFARVISVESVLCHYPWDLVSYAGEQLLRDLPLLAARLPRYTATDGQIVLRGEHIYVAPTVRLDGPLVLDARDGPIFIDDHAHIEPFTFIQGPTYIGLKAQISSSLIRGETSIGPVCRIGGEVEASTIQGFTNKHHEGFLGHSWLGEWVNIGAMTTTSDLKNTYGSVKVSIEQQGQIDSGQIKLGCFLADHVKLGIGLHLTGGAVVGTGSNIFGIHMVPKNVPPFTWGSEVFYEYRIDNMISVAHRVMGRRKQLLTAEHENMLRAVFAMTRPDRSAAGAALRLVADEPGRENLELLTVAESEAIRA